ILLVLAQCKQQTRSHTVGHCGSKQGRRIRPFAIAYGFRLIRHDIAELTEIDFKQVVLYQSEVNLELFFRHAQVSGRSSNRMPRVSDLYSRRYSTPTTSTVNAMNTQALMNQPSTAMLK